MLSHWFFERLFCLPNRSLHPSLHYTAYTKILCLCLGDRSFGCTSFCEYPETEASISKKVQMLKHQQSSLVDAVLKCVNFSAKKGGVVDLSIAIRQQTWYFEQHNREMFLLMIHILAYCLFPTNILLSCHTNPSNWFASYETPVLFPSWFKHQQRITYGKWNDIRQVNKWFIYILLGNLLLWNHLFTKCHYTPLSSRRNIK